MFARSSTIHAQASMIDAGIGHIRDTVLPAMTHIDQFIGLSVMVERATGRCIATSAWRTQDALRASADRAATLRDDAAEAFGGTAEVAEWEVAVMHRAHHARPGTCLRSTWGTTDPAHIDDAIEAFKFESLAKIEDLPGFCSASLLVNRAEGRAVVTVAYDSREALERSRERSEGVRAEAARASDLAVHDVAEFDLEVGHLHIPEKV